MLDEKVEAGQAIYNPLTLKLYDWLVLGVSNQFLWCCPTRHLRSLYQECVMQTHLDIGVGTGYFLDKVMWPSSKPAITLLDLNEHSLAMAAKRIERYVPKQVIANCLEPLPLQERYQSIGLCYLLHCVPGDIKKKAIVFDHAIEVLAPGGIIFGATILQGDTPRSWPAQALMNLYNKKGIFSNEKDAFLDLVSALDTRFEEVNIRRLGAVALFKAKSPKTRGDV